MIKNKPFVNDIVTFDIETIIDEINPENYIPVCIGYCMAYHDPLINLNVIESSSILAPNNDPEALQAWCLDQLNTLYGYSINENVLLIGWNSVGFDLMVLGTVANNLALAANVAFNSIDLLLNFMTVKGYPIGLQACSDGFKLSGKLKNELGESIRTDIDSLLTSNEGIELLLKYVEQDCILTFEVYQEIVISGYFKWIARAGSFNRLQCKALYNTYYCMQLPLVKVGFAAPTTLPKLTEWLKPFIISEENNE